jgi:hypothetical protein
MKIRKLIFVILGLISFANCFSQDSIVIKTFKKDSTLISTDITYSDVDLRISELNMELDSLYRIYQFKHPLIKTNLMINSKKIKDYILDLIKNGGFEIVNINVTSAFIYDFKYKNTSLSLELDNYIKSINDLDLNSGVKKVAIKKIQKLNDIKKVNSYTHKYNAAITILKHQLRNVIWSEIYIIDNESINK